MGGAEENGGCTGEQSFILIPVCAGGLQECWMLIPKGLRAGKKQEFHLEMGNCPWLSLFFALSLMSSPELMSWLSVLLSVFGFTLPASAPSTKVLLFGCFQPQFNWLFRDTLKFWGFAPGIWAQPGAVPGAGSPEKVGIWLVGSKQAGFWLETCSWLEFSLGLHWEFGKAETSQGAQLVALTFPWPVVPVLSEPSHGRLNLAPADDFSVANCTASRVSLQRLLTSY